MKRPRSHQIESESDAYLNRVFSEWECNKYNPDYGLDFRVTIFENEIITEHFFFVQNKGSDKIDIDVKNKSVNFDLDIKYLKFYIKLDHPVFLVRYDAVNKKAYWVVIQKYCRDILNKQDPGWISRSKGSKRIKIPLNNLLTDKEKIKTEVIQSKKELSRSFTDNLDVIEGYEFLINQPEKLEETFKKKEFQAIQGKLITSLSYFRNNKIAATQRILSETYERKYHNENHLQIILALLLSNTPAISGNFDYFRNLAEEGLKLSQELKNTIYINIFSFLKGYYELFEMIVARFPILMQIKYAEEYDFDHFIKILWESRNDQLEYNIKEIGIYLFKYLKYFIENKLFIEYIVLQLQIIFLDSLFYSIVKKFISIEPESESIKKEKEFYSKILDFAIRIEDNDVLLYTYFIFGGYYKNIGEKEKAINLFSKGLKLSNKLPHLYYQNRFKERLENIDDVMESPPYDINSIKNMPLQDFINITSEELINSLRIHSSDQLSREDLDSALNQLNLIEKLKTCQYLVIGLYPNPLGVSLGLHSLGIKKIGCLKRKGVLEDSDLNRLFEHFK